ncbi:MAG TPA: esterase-like activity of phytase family protein [Candidatus Binatia bacterium]
MIILAGAVWCSQIACLPPRSALSSGNTPLVDLSTVEVDPKQPQGTDYGALTLLSAFRLSSKDKRFGGLSGLSIGSDGRLYAISDNGYWLSARMVRDQNDLLLNLVDWQISPLLTPNGTAASGRLRDAEALTRAKDGSFLVAFEGVHRIWRYAAPPLTMKSVPEIVKTSPELARAPGNGGMEGIASFPDGRLLILTEEFANPDGSFKGWLVNRERAVELSYIPSPGFHVTDCAALDNGDVLVLERRYVPFGILSARITIVEDKRLRAGAKLIGKELLKLEQPLAAENYEGIAVQRTPRGTIIFIVSDDNYSSFQQTLLLQFLLPDPAKPLTSHVTP